MRFKKGSKVEVLDQKEVPAGSWCCAEIISGNGHYYSVKYDCYSEDTGLTVDRVPQKVIRPCPPSVMSPRGWVPGDIVEVYEKNSWKVAEISKVIGGSNYLVRLLGSSRKLRAHLSDLRMRLIWEDEIWVAIQKESKEFNNEIINSPSKEGDFGVQIPQSSVEMKTSGSDYQILKRYDGGFEQPQLTLGSKKRTSCLYSPQIDECSEPCKKMRFVEERAKHCRVLETLPSHLLEKASSWRLLKLATSGIKFFCCSRTSTRK